MGVFALHGRRKQASTESSVSLPQRKCISMGCGYLETVSQTSPCDNSRAYIPGLGFLEFKIFHFFLPVAGLCANSSIALSKLSSV